MHTNKLKQWEIALLLALYLTLSLGNIPCYGWWGTIFPQLTDVYGSETASEAMAYDAPWTLQSGQQKIEVRFRVLEQWNALKMRWG